MNPLPTLSAPLPPKQSKGYLSTQCNIFAPDSDVPELVFDVYLSTLPAYDRGQLQMGIPIYSYEELVQRIEDYIS